MIAFADYRLDVRAGRLWEGAHPVALRPKAWILLCYLVERPGVLVTKRDLHAAVWGDAIVTDHALTRTVGELRQALGDDARIPRIIETVHRRGFRFIAPLHDSPEEAPASTTSIECDVPPRGGRTLFVGRDPELARLGDLLRQASGSQRQIVFIEGEPGIGKSALVQAFLESVRQSTTPALIGYGQCVEQHGERETYMAVLEMLERLSRGPSGAEIRDALRSLAPSWLAQLPSLQSPADAERLSSWQTLVTPQRMLREFARLLEAISIQHPLVLVLEDLQWSDQGTSELVSVLAQRPEGVRLMLVATYRSAHATALDLPIQTVLSTLRARRRCVEIALEYLTRGDVATYLASRFHDSAIAEDVVSLVHRGSDGNPLFMILLVDHLLARGELIERDGILKLVASRPDIEEDVPHDLRQLLNGLFQIEPPGEQGLLEVASVAGVAFDAPTVAAGLGETVEKVESICHSLCRTQRWLEHFGSRDWPDGTLATRYRFRHPLYRRAIYDRLPPSRRATLHERVGSRLESGYTGQIGDVASELAEHFRAARDRRRALVYLEAAARRAYDRRAYRDVLASLEPALATLGMLPDTAERGRDELRLRALFAIVLSQTAGYTAANLFENVKRVRDLATQLDDVPAQFDALSELYLRHAMAGHFAEAEALGDPLAKLAERLGKSAPLQVCYLRGASALWKGDLRRAAAFLGRGIALPGSPDEADRPYGVNPIVAVRTYEGLRRWMTGDRADAHAVLQDAQILAEQHGRPFTVAHALTFRAVILTLDADWAEACRLGARMLEISDDYGFPLWRGAALVIQGRVLVEQGEPVRGLSQINEGLDLLRVNGLRVGLPLLLSVLATACLRVGDLEQGLAAVDAALTQCDETGGRFLEPEVWRLKGELLLRQSNARRRPDSIREAEACFEKARALARAQGARMLELRARGRRAGGSAARTVRRAD
jgi:DNA-binding winged helix-turn-helix (wHTH) protein/tetratricopeptide (TPR) repeat protein